MGYLTNDELAARRQTQLPVPPSPDAGRYTSAYALSRGADTGDKTASYQPSLEGKTIRPAPKFTNEIGVEQKPPAGVLLNVTPTSSQPQINPNTGLGGKLDAEVRQMRPIAPPSWGRGMAMNDVKPGEAMVTSYSPETTRTKFDNLGYQTQEKIPGTPTMIGYRQNDKTGQLEKFGADGSKLADLGSFKPHKDAEKNTAMFWANNGMPGGPAQYRQEREKQGIYRAMDGLMADATNGMMDRRSRENAAHMFGALAQRLDKFGSGDMTPYEKASLGLQEKQLASIDEYRKSNAKAGQLRSAMDYAAKQNEARSQTRDKNIEFFEKTIREKHPEMTAKQLRRLTGAISSYRDAVKEAGYNSDLGSLEDPDLQAMLEADAFASKTAAGSQDPAGPNWLRDIPNEDDAYGSAFGQYFTERARPAA